MIILLVIKERVEIKRKQKKNTEEVKEKKWKEITLQRGKKIKM